MTIEFDRSFPLYLEFDPRVPVYCVTPGTGRVIHRFFDTSPFSPSGRFMALFRMPFEDRPPKPGERGEIIVVDLERGLEQVVADTAGWEPQMGANINWGADNDTVVFNDVDTTNWTVRGVKLNWRTGHRQYFAKGVYHASPDGRYAVCADLETMRRTQNGYGVMIPDDRVPHFPGLSGQHGVWITDLETLETSLLVSIREAVERTVPSDRLAEYDRTENYFFHTKWNPQGTRLMFSLRRYPLDSGNHFNMMSDKMLYDVFTMTPDKRELYDAVDSEKWRNPGHHTNWFPDGERLSLNLAVDGGNDVKFCQVNYDGSDFHKMFDHPSGSGHPTVHISNRFLVTDAYQFESFAYPDGTTPLRLVDLKTREETVFARIPIRPPGDVVSRHIELRVDPHPAWDRTWRYLAFNALSGGTRKVFVADMNRYIKNQTSGNCDAANIGADHSETGKNANDREE